MRSMTVFNFLLEATVFGGVLILLVIAARALLRRRLGNRAIYAAWLVATVRLLLPLSLPNPVMDALRPGLSADVAARPVADQVRRRVIDAGLSMSGSLVDPASESFRDFAVQTSSGNTGKWLLLAWCGVAVVIGVWMLARNVRFRRQLKRDRVRQLEGEELEMYRRLCERYKVRPVAVYYAHRLNASCLNGVFQPFIAIPMDTRPEHLPLVLAHELCHQRAHDTVWALIRNLCCALHWFNPLVWLAGWLSRADSEMACDDRVTARLPELDRLAYADVIVSNAERGGTAACIHATGAHLKGKWLCLRVSSIIRYAGGNHWAVALGSIVAACVLCVSFLTGESEPLPTVSKVPSVTWVASAEPLAAAEDTVACARRFLESPFVGVDTSGYSFSVFQGNGEWRVEAREAAGTLPIVIRFSADGMVLEYDGTRALKGLSFSDTSYTHRTFTDSVDEYIAAFMEALIPGQTWHSGSATADVRAGEVRLVDGVLSDASGQPVCEITLQVEPGARVLYFHRTPDGANG